MPHLALARRACCSAEVVFQHVGEEAVLLDLVGEGYFGLDPVGTRIWQLLADAPLLEHVHGALRSVFDVEPARICGDLLALVDALSVSGLVEIECRRLKACKRLRIAGQR